MSISNYLINHVKKNSCILYNSTISKMNLLAKNKLFGHSYNYINNNKINDTNLIDRLNN